MKNIILLTVFLCVSQVVQSKNLDNHFRSNRTASNGCKKPGLQCSDCFTAVSCVDTGNGWESDVVNKCKESKGETCFNGQCRVNTLTPGCPTTLVPFPCTAVGMFPDPFDCNTFHVCCGVGTISDGIRCPEGRSYDPKSTYCSNIDPDYGCSNTAVPPCYAAGQTGAVPQNPSIYYICSYVVDLNGDQVFYPKLHLCPNGGIYSEGKCQ